MSDSHHIIHLPPLRAVARQATRHILEATLVPLALFYVTLAASGLHGALIAALAWSYAAVVWRLVTRQRVPGLLVLGSVLFTVRTAIAFATNSAFIYFLQPTLGNFMVAGLFLASVPLGKPLAGKLAHDFLAFPPSFSGNARVRRFFLRISLLWALVFITNGAVTLWLLLQSSIESFILLRPAGSFGTVILGIVVSSIWFFRSMRGEGIRLRFAARTKTPVPTPAV